MRLSALAHRRLDAVSGHERQEWDRDGRACPSRSQSGRGAWAHLSEILNEQTEQGVVHASVHCP